jgi:heat shock protein HtpX
MDMAWRRRLGVGVGLCGAVLAEGFFLSTLGGLLALWLLPIAIVVSQLVSTVVLPGVVGSGAFWLSFLGAVLVLLVAVQTVFVRRQTRTTLHTTGTAYPAAQQDAKQLTARLAQQADVPEPDLVIASTAVPASLTVGVVQPTIVVTEGLISKLETEAELRAVLAHEIGHIANRDVTVTSVVAAVPITIAGLLDRIVGLFRSLLGFEADEELSDTTKSVLVFVGPIVAVFGLMAVAIAVVPVVGGVLIALGQAVGGESTAALLVGAVGLVSVQLGMLGLVLVFALPLQVLAHACGSIPAAYISRTREFAADRVAAELTGEPETLATVLARLDDEVMSLPTRDARTLRSVQHLCLLPFDPESEHDQHALFDSHPATADRVERLRELTTA